MGGRSGEPLRQARRLLGAALARQAAPSRHLAPVGMLKVGTIRSRITPSGGFANMVELELSRRNFLKGVLSLTAVAATGLPAAPAVPRIYGDGVHCDVDGLQALIEGRPFIVESESIVAVEGLIRRGQFLLSRTLDVQPKAHLEILESEFVAAEGFEGDDLCRFLPRERVSGEVVIKYCIFRHLPTHTVLRVHSRRRLPYGDKPCLV